MFGEAKEIRCVEAQKVNEVTVSDLRNAIGGCPDGCGKLELFIIDGVPVLTLPECISALLTKESEVQK